MPRTIQGVDAYMRDPAHANRHQGDRWHNACEQFTNNAGDFNESFGTALEAGNASGWLDPDIAHISDGSIGYWSGVWIWSDELGRMEECGHTAFWYGGRWLMASDAVPDMVGNGTGTVTFADYARLRPFAIWRGHTKRHGTETLSLAASAASLNETEIDMPISNEDCITLLNAQFDVGGGRIESIKSALSAIFYYGDVEHGLETNIERISNVNWTLLNRPSEAIDTGKLATALAAAGVNVTIDPAALAKALDASLADNFAAIPAAVVAEVKAAL